ncbi:MAG: lasso peptide biosynthesis B2 protein [Silvibacterium sp.]
MIWLICKSLSILVYLDFIIYFRGFKVLHRRVREQPLLCPRPAQTSANVCHAVDLACVIYFKQVLCLQRSAATTILLRRQGCRAQMVIGVQLLPPKSHAWVEVGGMVINDKPYIADVYRELERC